MELGDVIAASQGLFLTATWAWVLRVKRNWVGWREKSALWAFLFASMAVFLDLLLTLVMHFRGESGFAVKFFLGTVIAGILLGIAGLTLALMGKGVSKIAALIWSSVVLLSAGVTIAGLAIAIWR